MTSARYRMQTSALPQFDRHVLSIFFIWGLSE
jgi:hypothetical protein